MKKSYSVYKFVSNGGFVESRIIPKNQRYKGVDGIEIRFAPSGAKKYKLIEMKDWEAVVFIEALSAALREKKLAHLRKRRK